MRGIGWFILLAVYHYGNPAPGIGVGFQIGAWKADNLAPSTERSEASLAACSQSHY